MIIQFLTPKRGEYLYLRTTFLIVAFIKELINDGT